MALVSQLFLFEKWETRGNGNAVFNAYVCIESGKYVFMSIVLSVSLVLLNVFNLDTLDVSYGCKCTLSCRSR